MWEGRVTPGCRLFSRLRVKQHLLARARARSVLKRRSGEDGIHLLQQSSGLESRAFWPKEHGHLSQNHNSVCSQIQAALMSV